MHTAARPCVEKEELDSRILKGEVGGFRVSSGGGVGEARRRARARRISRKPCCLVKQVASSPFSRTLYSAPLHRVSAVLGRGEAVRN